MKPDLHHNGDSGHLKLHHDSCACSTSDRQAVSRAPLRQVVVHVIDARAVEDVALWLELRLVGICGPFDRSHGHSLQHKRQVNIKTASISALKFCHVHYDCTTADTVSHSVQLQYSSA